MVDMKIFVGMALAPDRCLRMGHLPYPRDTLAAESWNRQRWNRATTIRESLFWIAAHIEVSVHDAT